ncbi:hypothetical protein AB1Y20_008930 [Prymnesium parvum]|uniref:Mannosyltransferase n=1 Tax=Prymnesium parvum TaxID=97485 RepID=A0AB34JZY6_PRYPA
MCRLRLLLTASLALRALLYHLGIGARFADDPLLVSPFTSSSAFDEGRRLATLGASPYASPLCRLPPLLLLLPPASAAARLAALLLLDAATSCLLVRLAPARAKQGALLHAFSPPLALATAAIDAAAIAHAALLAALWCASRGRVVAAAASLGLAAYLCADFLWLAPIAAALLSSAHLSSPHLSSAHLSSPHLSSPHLSSAHLSSPHLSSAHLSSPHLSSPHLSSPHLSSPHLSSPHLSSPHLSSAHLSSPHLSSPHLSSAHLSSPHLSSPHLSSPHLSSPHLSSPHLSSPHLSSPHLSSPHLSSPHALSYPHLSYPHLSSPDALSTPHLSSPRGEQRERDFPASRRRGSDSRASEQRQRHSPASPLAARPSLRVTAAFVCALLVSLGALLGLSARALGSWRLAAAPLRSWAAADALHVNVGLWWYLLCELFSPLRPQFVAAFHLLPRLWLVPLAIRMASPTAPQRLQLAAAAVSVAGVVATKPYAVLPDVAFSASLLASQVDYALLRRARPAVLMLAFAGFLFFNLAGHALLHAWSSSRSLNANFYYGATMVLGASQLAVVYEITAAILIVQSDEDRSRAAAVLQRAWQHRTSRSHPQAQRQVAQAISSHEPLEPAEPGIRRRRPDSSGAIPAAAST